MRRKIIVGNWKMNNTITDGRDFINQIKYQIDTQKVDVAICPTFVSLVSIAESLKDSNIKVGSQNVHFEDKGAFTGEVSVPMLEEIGIDYCIIGHSERRQYFNETDATVNMKVKRLLESDHISPIICVGEKLEERKLGSHFDIVKNQVEKAFDGIKKEQIMRCIIAYEPIWAIGTGETATSDEAETMCEFIRKTIAEIYDNEAAENVRIQYGGSVNGDNAREILTMPNIDGALVGGASLKIDFAKIVNYDII